MVIAAHRSPGLNQVTPAFPDNKGHVIYSQSVRGQHFRLKFCPTCHTVKAVRTFHCRVCNRCVHSHGTLPPL